MSAAELWERLRAAGGVVRVPEPDERTRAVWRRAFSAAVREEPDATSKLSFAGWRSGDVIVALARSGREYDLPMVRGDYGGRNPQEDAVPERMRSPSRRALQVIKMLSAAAKTRGHQVGAAQCAGRRPCDLCLIVRGQPFPLSIIGRGAALTVALPSHYLGRRTWTDGKRARVEQKLGDVLTNLEARAEAAEVRRAERERVETEERAATQALLEQARVDWIRDHKHWAVQRVAAEWRAARDVMLMCEAVRNSGQENLPSSIRLLGEWAQADSQWIESVCAGPETLQMPEPDIEDLVPYLAAYKERGIHND